MKKTNKHLLIFSAVFGTLMFTGCSQVKENIIQIINSSNTTLAYDLLEDNINPNWTYPKYEQIEFDDGYDYFTNDGSELYRFTKIAKYGENPVMSYLRINDNGNMDYKLFGVQLGSETLVHKNEFLGITKSSSLLQSFYNLGFTHAHDKQYINNSNWGISDLPYNWIYLVKDEIFLNFAVAGKENSPLLAFEIGLNVEEVNSKLTNEKNGLPFSVNEGVDLLFNREILLNDTYQSGSLIKLKIMKHENATTPSLYFNDEYIKEFSTVSSDYRYSYEALFFMPSYPIEVNIRFGE